MTSPAFGPSSLTVPIESGAPALVATAARTSMWCPPNESCRSLVGRSGRHHARDARCLPRSILEEARRLGGVGGEEVHQGRGQAIVWLEVKLLQPRANRPHLIGIGTGLDDRRDEGGELRRLPAGLLRQLGVDEIQAVERMLLVLDSAIQVNAAALAGVPLDGPPPFHDVRLVVIPGTPPLS